MKRGGAREGGRGAVAEASHVWESLEGKTREGKC